MKQLIWILLVSVPLVSFGQSEKLEIYFELEQSELNRRSKDRLLIFLEKKGISAVEILGYADSTGNQKRNEQLSLDRAKSVRSFLLENGLETQFIAATEGRGERTTFEDLSKNRVVIIKYVLLTPVDDSPDIDGELKKEIRSAEIEEVDHISKTRDGELNQETVESLKIGDILNIGGIEFQPVRHVLTKRSQKPLKKLIKIMEDNPGLKIEIQGHICCQAQRDGLDKDTGTMNLSENRAITIYNQLIRAGISKDRLTYKGYGPFRKLAVEVDDESRQRNRRVSIEILEK